MRLVDFKSLPVLLDLPQDGPTCLQVRSRVEIAIRLPAPCVVENREAQPHQLHNHVVKLVIELMTDERRIRIRLQSRYNILPLRHLHFPVLNNIQSVVDILLEMRNLEDTGTIHDDDAPIPPPVLAIPAVNHEKRDDGALLKGNIRLRDNDELFLTRQRRSPRNVTPPLVEHKTGVPDIRADL